MKFHRITKPLTALALCALLATAYNISVAPSFAADDKKVIADSKDKDSAKEKKAAKAEAKEAAKKEENKDEPADTAAAGEDETPATDETASDDIMPPMATASKTEIPADLPTPNDSKLAPDVKRMRTVDLGEAGSSDAFVPTEREIVSYVEPVGDTHPTLNLTPDKSIIVRLDRPAASVLVGNDAHVNVMIDTPTTLVVIPRMPGAGYFTVLDEERRIIMKRHVIVGPAGQYVRVRRSCASNSSTCQHTSTFYCPDGMCHPVETQQRPGSPPQQSQASSGGGGGGMMGSTSSEDADFSNQEFPTFPDFPFIPIPFPIPGFGGADNGE